METSAGQHARAILAAALERVDPLRMMGQALSLEGTALHVAAGSGSFAVDLRAFKRIVAFGAGKASARMALGLEAILGDRLSGGVVAVKPGYTESLARIELLESAHPVPDGRSVVAARRILDLGRGAGPDTLFAGLTSGGGSALLCLPAPGLELGDKQETTRLLLACGATIQEVNGVRKHLSAIKGGRLAAALAPGTVLNLILSDVVGDDLSAIASGITAPDPTTYRSALDTLERRSILPAVPEAVRSHLEAGDQGLQPETPKPGDPAFDRTRNLIVGSNRLALSAAETKARALGYRVHPLPEPLIGEAREAGARLADLARSLRGDGPLCLLAGGETTVTVRGNGRGGRNQELALAVLAQAEDAPGDLEGITLLSAGTDGNDGPTDVAGAFASREVLERAQRLGLRPSAFLERNDSHAFFRQAGGHLVTGPTNTNVCDIQIVIVESASL